MALADGRAVLLESFARACRPRRRLTVSQWADAHRVLTGKSSQEVGRWRTSRTPYAREPMDALSVHSPVQKVVVMAAIQMLKTEIGLNWTGYIIDHAPAPLLSVQPTLEMRDRYVLQRVNPMLEACDCLADKVNARAQRSASNSRDVKDFPGGMAVFSGANSPSSLRSMPIKYVIADEVDSFPWDVGRKADGGGEGDPLGLIEARQSNFSRSKILIISSPTMKDASVIEDQFLAGDQRRYHVPCPHCSEFQHLKWKQLHWMLVDGNVKEVWYVCEHCGCEIEEHCKPQMLADGRWIAERKHARHRSYHINALYSPIGLGMSWAQLVYEWLAAQSDPVKLKRFVNTRLAETWEDLSRNLKWHMLADRAEDYALRSVPPGALVLTAGIDTQNDRLAILVAGWGRHGTCWIIDYVELPGDPVDQVQKFLQQKGALYDYLTQPFVNAWGKEMRIQAAGWDTGGQRTDAVYTAVRARLVPRLLAFKGASTPGKAILAPRPSHQDVNWRGKTIKKGVALWLIGTDTAKDVIAAHLAADAEKEAEERKIRFSHELDEDFYKMLIAEKFDPEKNRWIKPGGRRNEAIDCLVYAMAASRHPELRVHAMPMRAWNNLERMLQPGEKTENTKPDDGVVGENRRMPRRRRRRRRGGFVGGF